MADQRFRSQQRDPSLSPASTSGAKGRFSPRGEDPLAELARLIGQDDPFSGFSDDPRAAPRPTGNGNAPRNGHGRDRHSAQDYDERDAYAREPQAPARQRRYTDDDPRYADADAARKNGRGAYAYGGGRDEAPYRRAPEPDIGRVPNDARQLPPQTAKRQPRPADYAQEVETDYEDPRYARGARGGNGYADPRQAHDQGPYDQDDAAGYEPEYEDEHYAGEYDEPAYVDPAAGRRRWLYIGVVAAIGFLVVGGAGVYGYRALFGKYSGGTAPTIRPADTPSKVAPTAQTGDAGQKLIYDRLDGPKQGERIVSREEKPADVAQGTGRVVTAPQQAGPVTAFAPVPGAVQNAPAAITGTAPGAVPATEPRKVRTTTVRSDGTIVDVPRPAPQPAAQRQAQGQPLALNPYTQQQPAQTDDPDPDAQQPARTAALTQPPARTNQPGNQQPWAMVQPTAPAAPAPQQASNQPASNYVPAGSYVVQVASQKTEADARTSWQQLQAKYANVFGSHQANIKRVDLGDRGTFFRAMLGPFANRDQAYEMCQNLKAAGGECIVQRN